ncbi:methyltransferase [Massilia sp. erpn]|nr:methyltransferase [Massilia sp. erpn]
MSEWSAGYVSDIDYTYGYYHELNPARIKLAFLNAGLAYPDVRQACELGYGQGLSINLHAAAADTQWHGTDFNPAQAGFAQSLAAASGAAIDVRDEAFLEFCQRADLPAFDSISLHGIWSWVSDENRAIITDFLRRKLKVGGVLYISYNTQPGWAQMAPMRDLLQQYHATMVAPGLGSLRGIDAALAFAENLMATDPGFARANPQVAERLNKMKGQDRTYLAHEYFNQNWLPMSFARMNQWLEPAKLSYACSATYMDHVEGLDLTEAQFQLLKALPDVTLRESTRDFMVNQQFRRDYWVRGARRLSPVERNALLRAQRVMLTWPRADIGQVVKGTVREATLNESVHAPIMDYLADLQPRTIDEIAQMMAQRAVSFERVMQALIVLAGMSVLSTVQDELQIARAKPRTDRLNLHLCGLARAQGLQTPEQWAGYVQVLVREQGERLQKDGQVLESLDAELAEITAQARVFAAQTLPLLRTMQVI